MAEVTIAIPTYARTAYLKNALWCCLQQTVPCSVLVLNDCEKQTLGCSVNCGPIKTLGEKRNRMLSLINTPWTCWLDDDDWILPWYVESLLAEVTGDYNMIQPSAIWMASGKPPTAWDRQTAAMPCLVRTSEALGKFPAMQTGEDQGFRDNMHCKRVEVEPGYVYRWGNGTHHASGGGQDMREQAAERFERGEEPTGVIELQPTKPDLGCIPEAVRQRAGW